VAAKDLGLLGRSVRFALLFAHGSVSLSWMTKLSNFNWGKTAEQQDLAGERQSEIGRGLANCACGHVSRLRRHGLQGAISRPFVCQIIIG
jgi:hypothetical protein